MTQIAVLPGDGIGPEVTAAAVRVLRAVLPSCSFVEAPVGAENVPLGADQAYASAPALGPVAVAVRFTALPTVVSEGLAETPEATAQLYVWAPIAADPASGAGDPHCMRTVTLVVWRLVTEKLVEPAQVTVPSTVVPEIETL